MSKKKKDLRFCSFCGKGHEEVEKLIAGPGVSICNSCVRVCQGVLREEGVTPPRSDAVEILSKIRLLVELHGDGMLNDQDHIAKVAELVGEEPAPRTGESESN